MRTRLMTGAFALATTGLLLAGTAATAAPALNTSVAPGGNFDLSRWELQLPTGSPGKPTTISPSQLKGKNGYQNKKHFYTDKTDGSMTFWDPEKGVHTTHSKFPRAELREMNANGSPASWSLHGTHKLNATVKVTKVPDHVCVGQVHLATGSGSTKPLLELFYHKNGDIEVGIEDSPSGGQTQHPITNVPLGTKWSYTIAITGGNTITITINGNVTKKFPIPSSFNGFGMYFKAGDYDQTAGSSTKLGALVHFYALSFSHA